MDHGVYQRLGEGHAARPPVTVPGQLILGQDAQRTGPCLVSREPGLVLPRVESSVATGRWSAASRIGRDRPQHECIGPGRPAGDGQLLQNDLYRCQDTLIGPVTVSRSDKPLYESRIRSSDSTAFGGTVNKKTLRDSLVGSTMVGFPTPDRSFTRMSERRGSPIRM
jgi:hypothetical protein